MQQVLPLVNEFKTYYDGGNYRQAKELLPKLKVCPIDRNLSH